MLKEYFILIKYQKDGFGGISPIENVEESNVINDKGRIDTFTEVYNSKRTAIMALNMFLSIHKINTTSDVGVSLYSPDYILYDRISDTYYEVKKIHLRVN